MDGQTDPPKPAAAQISVEQGEGPDEEPIPEEHLGGGAEAVQTGRHT